MTIGIRTAALAACVGLGSLAAGGGGCDAADDAPRCLQSLTGCEPTCMSGTNLVRTCTVDAKRFIYTPCGDTASCVAGECKPRLCTSPGEATCRDNATRIVCSDDGMSQDEVSCGTDELCRGGACIPAACTSGQEQCTLRSVLRCLNDAWTELPCSPTQICAVGNLGPTCVEPMCAPGTARCDRGLAKLCDRFGAAESVINCIDDATCADGFCHPAVCDVDLNEDVVQGDTAAPTNATVRFTLNQVEQVFDLNAHAEFVGPGSLIQISASKGSRSLQIEIGPVSSPASSGSFSSDVFSEVKVLICYDDGTDGPTAGLCDEGFNFASDTYTLRVETNPGPDSGFLIGSFTTTLKDASSAPLVLTDGVFEVDYR